MLGSKLFQDTNLRTWVRGVSRLGTLCGVFAMLVFVAGCPTVTPCDTDEECDNGEFCDGAETCVDGGCESAENPCAEGERCNEAADRCDECVINAECDDDVFCNGAETCTNGLCGEGPDPCTPDEICDEDNSECDDCDSDDDCDDGVFCNGEETCEDGECVDGDAPCAAGEACDEDNGECTPPCLLDSDCDDNDECTIDDCGTDGVCDAIPVDCDDDDLCTDDTCDPDTGCANTAVMCPAGQECDPDTGDCEAVTVESVTIVATPASQAEGNTGTTNFNFTVTRAGGTAARTINFAVTGGATATDANAQDFTGAVLPSGTVVYAAAENGPKTITVGVVGDTIVEMAEVFTVTLTDPANANAVLGMATATITNDDSGMAPVNTIPSNASAQVGQTTPIPGVSVADADNSTLTVNLATTNGLIQFMTIAAGASAVDQNNQNVAAGQNKTSITLSGTIANINTTLTSLQYTTDRIATNPGTDVVTITSTDSNGGQDIDAIMIAVGVQINLTAGSDTGAAFQGTAGGDNFLATTATFLGQGDIFTGGDGRDQAQLNGFGAANVPNAPTGTFSVMSLEQVFLNLAVGGAGTLDLSLIGGVDTVLFTPAAASAGNLDINNAPNAFTLRYRPTVANDFDARNIDVDIANAVFGSQSFTLRLEGSATQVADFTVLASTSGNIETVNVVSTSSDGTAVNTLVNAISGTSTINVNTVNFSGEQKLNAGRWGGANTLNLNGAGMTGDLTVTSTVQGVVITGGAGVDTLNGGANSQSIAGGAGGDTINPGAASDLVDTGTGADTIVAVAADIAAAGGGVVYDRWTGFTAGAGGDALDYNTALNKNGVAIGPPFAQANFLSTAIGDLVVANAAATVGIVEFTGTSLGANNIVPGTTTSATIEGWAATALATVDHHAATDFFLFVMYDNGTGSNLDAAVFLFDGDATATGMLAAEFRLLAVIEGVGQDAITFDNFK